MTTKVQYKKELFSLPVDVAETLKKYAEETHKKKSHIVAEAIEEFVKNHQKTKNIDDLKKIIGFAKGCAPDIQEIKENRYD